MSTPPAQNDNTYLQAFQLGWTLVEILGRVGRGMRLAQSKNSVDSGTTDQAKIYYARLSISTGRGKDNKTEQFRTAVSRWEALAQALGLITKETGAEHPLRAPLEMLKQCLSEQSTTSWPSVSDLRADLQQWGLEAHAQLATRDVQLGVALITGASLADTFWYLLPPTQPPSKKKLRDKDWRELLAPYRLFELRQRLASLEKAFPPYTLAVIYEHLHHWQIGQALFYGKDEKLRCRRSLTWWRKKVRKSAPGAVKQLECEDERAIHAALEKQVEQWADLIGGWKRPEQFLSYGDYRKLDGAYLLTIALGALLTGLTLMLLMYVWMWITIRWIGPAISNVLAQGNLKDRLLLLSTITGWLGTWFLVGKVMVLQTTHVAKAIRKWLTGHIIARRTLVPWDKKYKKSKVRQGKEEA